MEIKVLWIEDEPTDSVIDRADSKGVHIEVKQNVDAGVSELIHNGYSYDAIILDANCISHDDGTLEPDISALAYALKRLNENKVTTPWFVYSGGGFSGEESIGILVKGQERPYDEKLWYKKPAELEILLDKIISVVEQQDLFQMKMKYPEILCWYPNTSELVKILMFIEEKRWNDADIFNLIRKELEWVMRHCHACGLLQTEFKGSNLSECSTFLGRKELKDIVPVYIQRSLHSTCSVCNEGSHNSYATEDVKNGRAPYLVRSTIMEFLNILYWLKDIPTSPEDVEDTKRYVTDALSHTVQESFHESASDTAPIWPGDYEYEAEGIVHAKMHGERLVFLVDNVYQVEDNGTLKDGDIISILRSQQNWRPIAAYTRFVNKKNYIVKKQASEQIACTHDDYICTENDKIDSRYE